MAETFEMIPVNEPVEETIPITTDAQPEAPVITDPKVAQQRAFRWTVANPTLDEQSTMNAVFDGKESILRFDMAAHQNYQRTLKTQDLIVKAAQYKGSPLTPQEHKFILDKAIVTSIQGLNVPTDPATVMEEFYAGNYLKSSIYDTANRLPEGFMAAAIKNEPRMVEQINGVASVLLTKSELLRTKIEDLKEVEKKQPLVGLPNLTGIAIIPLGLIQALRGGAIGDWAKDFLIPFYHQGKVRGNVQGVGSLDGVLLGENIKQQSMALWRLPPAEFKKEIDRILDPLSKDNPGLAVSLAENLAGMSTNERLFYNLITPLDFIGLGGVAKGAARRAKTFNEVRTAYRDVLAASNDPNLTRGKIVESSGDMVEGTVQRAMETIRSELQGTSAPSQSALDSLTSNFRNFGWNYKWNRGDGTRELFNRVEQNMDLFPKKLMEILGTVQRVATMPDVLTTEATYRKLIADIKEFYPKKFIADTSPLRHERLSNTYSTEITLHRPDGKLWMDEQVARNYARDPSGLARPDAEIIQDGQGFKIIFQHQFRQNDPIIRNLLSPAPGAHEAPSWTRSWINRIRTPEDVNTKQDNLNRKVAVYAKAELEKLFKEQGDYIRDLSRGIIRNDPVTGAPIPSYVARPKAWARRLLLGNDSDIARWNEWESVVKYASEAINPSSRIRGYFFEQQGELNGYYLTHFQRLPTHAETEAYFSMRNMREGGRILENIHVLNKKLRLGAEEHVIYAVTEAGAKHASTPVEGVLRKRFTPSSNDNVLLMGTQLGHEALYGPGNPFSPTLRRWLTQKINKGELKVIELLEPGKRPLEGFVPVTRDARVRYVITPYVETRQLKWNQVPMSGPFKEFPYEFTVGKAKIKSEQFGSAPHPTYWYEGDEHMAGFMVRAEGTNYAKHMNIIQAHIKADDWDAARAYSNKYMNRDWDEIVAYFQKTNLDEPFQVIPRHGKINDIDKELEKRYTRPNPQKNNQPELMLRDGTRTGLLSGQTGIMGDDLSDVLTVKDIGSRINPYFDHQPTKMIDPIPANDRALTKLINSTFMDDYKITSMESWIKRAEPYLEAKEYELQASPYYYFHHPVWKQDANAEIVRNLETERFNIERLVGTPSAVQSGLHAKMQALYDAAYEKGKRVWLTPEWLLPKVTDPVQFLRSVVFHSYMGLYNIAQIFNNINTYVNIFAFAGAKYAAPGTTAAILHGLAAVNRNPSVLKTLDNIASKFGWRPGEWIESLEELNKTGFKHIQGEHIMSNTQLSPQTIAGAGHAFLDSGLALWRGTEKAVRIGAWHTAMREFRDLNPHGRITDAQRAAILDRADFFAANMSRASASMIHTGALSIPTHFFAYQIRIAEAFWSAGRMGSFTSAEGIKNRARVLLTYSLAYGVPGATGVTGIPLYDAIRQSALDNGYNPGDEYLRTMFHEGIPATVLALATGRYYNIGDKYALQGMEIFKDIYRNDKGFLTILMGAAGSRIASVWEGATPMTNALIGFFQGNGAIKPKWEDGLDILKSLSSTTQNAERTWVAMNTGKWMSKRGVFLEGQGETGKPIGTVEALLMGLSGVSPSSASDIIPLTFSEKNRIEMEKKGIQHFTREWRRMHEASAAKDDANAKAFFNRAYWALTNYGIPEHRWPAIMDQASQGLTRSLREQMDWNRVRDARPEQRDQRIQTYQNIQQQRQQAK